MLSRVRIRKYVLPSGSCPFDDWFDALTTRAQAIVAARLDRVSLGNSGEINSVGEGVFELKFRPGAGVRIYYARSGQEVILLLCAGDKSTQSRDIATARRYWRLAQSEN